LKDLGRSNSFVEMLCGLGGKEGCEKTLEAPINKLIPNLAIGDIALVYFVANSIYLLLIGLLTSSDKSIILLIFPFGISLLVGIYSIWYQSRVIKVWCPLCLVVIGIICFQSIVFFLYFVPPFYFTGKSYFQNSFLLVYGVVFLMSALWIVVKQNIIKKNELDVKQIELLRWKRDPELFVHFLTKNRFVNAAKWENDFYLGSADAPIQLLVVCNPYCKPCATMHFKLEKLLELYSDKIGIIVRFSLNFKVKDDPGVLATNTILNAYYTTSVEVRGKLLDNWFKLMNLDLWKSKIHLNELLGQNEIITRYEKWCEDSQVLFTPTLFVNGYEFPSQYNPEDISLIVPSLVELLETEKRFPKIGGMT
jgi:Thioredoxin/Vitamin K epoxide reductase family